MAEVVFEQLILNVSESVPSQAIRNTGNAYLVELKWLGRQAAGTDGWKVELQASNDLEAWRSVGTLYTFSASTSPPDRIDIRCYQNATTTPDVDVGALMDGYAYVRLVATNNDTGARQLISAAITITRYSI